MARHRQDSSGRLVTIRVVTPTDSATVRGLFMSAFASSFAELDGRLKEATTAYVNESLADDLADPYAHYMSSSRTCFFLSELDGRAVGMCGIDAWPDDDSVAQLRRVAVAVEARRLGVGRRMMRHAEEWSAAHGYSSIRFHTVDLLKPAIAMYESLGYRLIARHQFGPVNGLEYGKQLEPPRA